MDAKTSAMTAQTLAALSRLLDEVTHGTEHADRADINEWQQEANELVLYHTGQPCEYRPAPRCPMEENSDDYSARAIETLKAPVVVELEECEDFAVDPSGMVALDIDASQERAPFVVRLHPTLAALLATFKEN